MRPEQVHQEVRGKERERKERATCTQLTTRRFLSRQYLAALIGMNTDDLPSNCVIFGFWFCFSLRKVADLYLPSSFRQMRDYFLNTYELDEAVFSGIAGQCGAQWL